MNKNDILAGTRHFIYVAGAICLSLFQYVIADIFKQDTYDEGGIMENLQIAILAISCLLFFIIGKKYKKCPGLSFLFSSFCALAVCRELDALLDECLPVISWRIGFLFLIPAVIFAIKHAKDFWQEIASFVHTPPFSMLCNAFIVILPVAQLVGHNKFIKKILVNIEKVGAIKELFEENLETFGYYLILCSAVELLFWCKNSLSQESSHLEE